MRPSFIYPYLPGSFVSNVRRFVTHSLCLLFQQPRGPKKHLKRLNAPHHWMLDKLSGQYVSVLVTWSSYSEHLSVLLRHQSHHQDPTRRGSASHWSCSWETDSSMLWQETRWRRYSSNASSRLMARYVQTPAFHLDTWVRNTPLLLLAFDQLSCGRVDSIAMMIRIIPARFERS